MVIYLPLVVICIAARAILPRLDGPGRGHPAAGAGDDARTCGAARLLAGLILAAPFGAVMATVSSYLVVIASGVVRDVYQRFLRPSATAGELRRLSYLVMIVVGAIAVVANLRPVAYLQAIVVFSGTAAAATFVVPALMIAYWRRATAAGALAAMLAGLGHDARPVRGRLDRLVARLRPDDRARDPVPALLRARPRADRLGPGRVAGRRGRREPAEPPPRPRARPLPLRRPPTRSPQEPAP